MNYFIALIIQVIRSWPTFLIRAARCRETLAAKKICNREQWQEGNEDTLQQG